VPLRHEADVLNAVRLTQQMLVAASRTFLVEIRTPEFVACIARTPAYLIELNRPMIQTPTELTRSDELMK
jgi:hypothetical protein